MSQRSFAMTCALLGLASGQVLAAMNRFGYVFEPREPHEIYQIPKPDSTFRFETICTNKKRQPWKAAVFLRKGLKFALILLRMQLRQHG